MTRVLRWLGVALVLLLVAAFGIAFAARFLDGPIGPIPGGPLSGELVEGPEDDWHFAADIEEIELELNPESPRSIAIWCIVHEGRLYLPAAMAESKRWPGQVLEDGRVRLRIQGRLYAREAVRVAEHALVTALTVKLASKYGVDTGGGYYEEPWFFWITGRN